jgi:hypothetical protein
MILCERNLILQLLIPTESNFAKRTTNQHVRIPTQTARNPCGTCRTPKGSSLIEIRCVVTKTHLNEGNLALTKTNQVWRSSVKRMRSRCERNQVRTLMIHNGSNQVAIKRRPIDHSFSMTASCQDWTCQVPTKRLQGVRNSLMPLSSPKSKYPARTTRTQILIKPNPEAIWKRLGDSCF